LSNGAKTRQPRFGARGSTIHRPFLHNTDLLPSWFYEAIGLDAQGWTPYNVPPALASHATAVEGGPYPPPFPEFGTFEDPYTEMPFGGAGGRLNGSISNSSARNYMPSSSVAAAASQAYGSPRSPLPPPLSTITQQTLAAGRMSPSPLPSWSQHGAFGVSATRVPGYSTSADSPRTRTAARSPSPTGSPSMWEVRPSELFLPPMSEMSTSVAGPSRLPQYHSANMANNDDDESSTDDDSDR
jgi:hypothetical protein